MAVQPTPQIIPLTPNIFPRPIHRNPPPQKQTLNVQTPYQQNSLNTNYNPNQINNSNPPPISNLDIANPSTPKKKRRWPWFLLGFLFILLILGIGVGLYTFFGDKFTFFQ